MTIRRIQTCCRAVAAALAGGSALVIGAALLLPYDGASREPVRAASRSVTAPPAMRPVTMKDFEPFVGTALRPPLPAPPPPPPPPVMRTPQPPVVPIVQPGAQLHLLGTVTEPNNSYAIFQTPGGTELKHQGETIDGARVVHIAEGVVVVRFGKESVTYLVPRPN
jgi:hypothetical protein